MQIINISLAKS